MCWGPQPAMLVVIFPVILCEGLNPTGHWPQFTHFNAIIHCPFLKVSLRKSTRWWYYFPSSWFGQGAQIRKEPASSSAKIAGWREWLRVALQRVSGQLPLLRWASCTWLVFSKCQSCFQSHQVLSHTHIATPFYLAFNFTFSSSFSTSDTQVCSFFPERSCWKLFFLCILPPCILSTGMSLNRISYSEPYRFHKAQEIARGKITQMGAKTWDQRINWQNKRTLERNKVNRAALWPKAEELGSRQWNHLHSIPGHCCINFMTSKAIYQCKCLAKMVKQTLKTPFWIVFISLTFIQTWQSTIKPKR